eukprot:scaffold67432_cov27-Phaeocystis_antarctica.AAC.1
MDAQLPRGQGRGECALRQVRRVRGSVRDRGSSTTSAPWGLTGLTTGYASSKEQGLTQAEFVTLWREGVAQQRCCAGTLTLTRTLTRTSCPP